MNRTQEWWDKYLLDLARLCAVPSKDPSTRCGAVIVDEQRRIRSTGYNGFARGVEDRVERYTDRAVKLAVVVHAEANAIVFARENLTGCTLYTWPLPCCSQCAALVIQSGISRVVAPAPRPDILARWADSLKLAREQFDEAGVSVKLYEGVDTYL